MACQSSLESGRQTERLPIPPDQPLRGVRRSWFTDLPDAALTKKLTRRAIDSQDHGMKACGAQGGLRPGFLEVSPHANQALAKRRQAVGQRRLECRQVVAAAPPSYLAPPAGALPVQEPDGLVVRVHQDVFGV